MRKKIKINKIKSFFRRHIYVVIISVIVITLIISFFLYSNYEKKKLIKDINNHYSNIIKISKNAKLYSKNKKVIGTVKKGFTFSLNKKKINSIDDKYFNIKDTEYYLFYKDLVKINKLITDKVNDNYLVFNKNIESKKVDFYINNKKVITLNKSLSLPINYMDDNYYYVNYLNRLMQIKKDKVKIVDKENNKYNESSYISVINYNKIYDKEHDKCNDIDCVDISFIRNNIKYLKDNGFYTITLEEYKSWLNGNIRLKEKAILLLTGTDIELVNNIKKEENVNIEKSSKSDLKFNETNTKNTKDNKDYVNTYIVKNKTSEDDFKKMVAGEAVVEKTASSTNASSGGPAIPVLNYHFFYDPNSGEACNENICLQTDVFRKQLSYLRDNGYKTLTIEEFKKWMYNEISLPEKSILITIDDGAMGTSSINGNKLIPILEEYKMNATLFLITAWWDKSNYQSKYLDVESHGDDIHITGNCGKAKVHCLSKDELVTDFKLSVGKLGTNTAFCFPFYAYNETAIEAAKESGFKLAFIGGSRKAKQSDNKYMIPRYPIHKSTSWEQFVSMVS